MRYGKVFIGLFTALLTALAFCVITREYAWDGTVKIHAQIQTPSGQERLSCWEGPEDTYYLFLPSYAELSQTTLHSDLIAEASLAGTNLDQLNLEDLQLDTRYPLEYRAGGSTLSLQLCILRSGDLPTLHVDTVSETMSHIHEAKGNREAGTLRLYSAQGSLEYSGRLEALAGRGNSTWEHPKKPYNLALAAEANLLNMGAAKNWILLANAMDDTHMRNKLSYDFANAIGLSYSPECQWVDLYLNGEYAGLYLLSERNEIHPQRVDIPAENSFLVSKEWEWRMDSQGDSYVTTQSGAAFRLRGSSLDTGSVLSILQSAENAILAPDGIDPSTGMHWRDLLDVDSWVKKYLMEEVFGNTDGQTLSQYFYYDGTKLYAGPVWDYDLTMGNEIAIQMEYPNQIFASRPGIWGSSWYPELYEQEEFYAQMVSTYQNTFLPALEELLSQGISQCTAQIAKAAALDQLRWNTNDLAEEADRTRDYMTRRFAFLEDLWIRETPFVRFIANGYDGSKKCYYLPAGALPPQLVSRDYLTDVEFLGWFYEGTDVPFDPQTPITQDTEIRLRYQALPPAEPAPEPEAPSPLRYAPIAIFTAMLALVTAAEVRRNTRRKSREPAAL